MRPVFNARIDISNQPGYVQEAAFALRLERKSIERAEAGSTWLDEHAPAEWRLRLMRITSGLVLSRVNFRYNKDYPLGLAFAADARFDHDSDERRWINAAVHFDFEAPLNENRKFLALGFHEQEWRHGAVVVPKEVDIEFLNFGWLTVLGNFHAVGVTRSILTAKGPLQPPLQSSYAANLPGGNSEC
jgi:hypothetical protein